MNLVQLTDSILLYFIWQNCDFVLQLSENFKPSIQLHRCSTVQVVWIWTLFRINVLYEKHWTFIFCVIYTIKILELKFNPFCLYIVNVNIVLQILRCINFKVCTIIASNPVIQHRQYLIYSCYVDRFSGIKIGLCKTSWDKSRKKHYSNFKF